MDLYSEILDAVLREIKAQEENNSQIPTAPRIWDLKISLQNLKEGTGAAYTAKEGMDAFKRQIRDGWVWARKKEEGVSA